MFSLLCCQIEIGKEKEEGVEEMEKSEVMVVFLSAGTLMELGISPIVTSSLIMQVSEKCR